MTIENFQGDLRKSIFPSGSLHHLSSKHFFRGSSFYFRVCLRSVNGKKLRRSEVIFLFLLMMMKLGYIKVQAMMILHSLEYRLLVTPSGRFVTMKFWGVAAVVLIVQITESLTAVEKYFLGNIYVDSMDINIEIELSSHPKRGAFQLSNGFAESAPILSPNTKSRYSHYWTRKRGPDTSTLYPFTLHATNEIPTDSHSSLNSRKKRQSASDVTESAPKVLTDAIDSGNLESSNDASDQSLLKSDQNDDQSSKPSPRRKNGRRGRSFGGPFVPKR
jgi:hypothetical protein